MKSSRDELASLVSKHLSLVQLEFDAYQRDWFLARPPEFFCLELCGEAGELANLEKKRWRGDSPNPEHTAEEAADVFIALMNFANASGINLAEAVALKLHRI